MLIIPLMLLCFAIFLMSIILMSIIDIGAELIRQARPSWSLKVTQTIVIVAMAVVIGLLRLKA